MSITLTWRRIAQGSFIALATFTAMSPARAVTGYPSPFGYAVRRPVASGAWQPQRYVQQLQRTAHHVPAAVTPEAIITKPNYDQFRGAVVDLLRRFPPSQHVFVGVGRSPAPLMALMQNLDSKLAFNFPASGLRAQDPTRYFAAYAEHFAALLPAEVLRGNKSIVLVDRSVAGSGSSIAKLKGVLETYLHSIGSSVKVKGIGFSESAPAYGLEFLPTTSYPVLNNLNHDAWEGVYGEYPHHPIGLTPLSTAVRRPEYDRVKALLKAHMDNDPVLQGARAQLGLE